jgi:8-oxo-dGTP diphosphatase
MTKITEVAVAILLQADGSFLLSSRPEGKPYPGYWEFPGGKIEPGETVRAALVRELAEELNVTITHATPWFTFMMHYTHATVRLHCWRVTQWHGEMRGMEGQHFAWQRAEDLWKSALSVAPTLPGCVPIFKALMLPPVYAITNASEMGVEAYLQHLRVSSGENALRSPQIQGFDLKNMMRMMQVREKAMSHDALTAFAKEVIAVAHRNEAKVLINSDVALAELLNADGVHLTSAQLATLDARPPLPLVGASVHSRAELERAAEFKCDFAVLGAVNATRSHPGQAPMGWAKFAETVDAAPIPCYAIGGMRINDLETAIEHGAHGIAMQRGM